MIDPILPASELPASERPVSPLPNTPQKADPSRPPELLPPQASKRLPIWRFWAVMLIQSALIAAVPFQSALTYATGKTVTIQTQPVDPYDLLRGYSQTLSFDISNLDTLEQIPGAATILSAADQQARAFYVILESPEAPASDVPVAWQPVAVSLALPESLADNQVALKGRKANWNIRYGLETYYMPESQREAINDHINQTQQSDFVVDVKIDAKGNSVPLSLWVGDQQYRF